MGRLSHCLALHLLLLSAASFELDNQLRSLYAREGALVLDERLLLRRDRALAPRQEKKEADNLGEPAGPVEWINAEREREASVAPTGAGDADRENRWYLHEVRRWQRRLAKMAGKLKSAGARRSERARRQEVLGAEEGLGRAEKDDLEGRVKAAGRERNRVERDWEKMEQTAARKVRDLKAIEGAVRHQIGREHEATEQMDRLARKAAKEAERFARESRARPGRAANYAFMRERESTNLKAVAGTMLSRQQSAITRDKMALSTLQAAQGLLLPESTAPTLGEPDEGADSSATTEQLRAQLAKLKRRVSRMAREMVRVRRAGRDQAAMRVNQERARELAAWEQKDHEERQTRAQTEHVQAKMEREQGLLDDSERRVREAGRMFVKSLEDDAQVRSEATSGIEADHKLEAAGRG
eukprot:TRINITY_DN4896_c0_g1_i1.p1 TRINITY_DN4896_c0_g1~~TRINITY_DN4896_c0_g1_i1.p1  ORF type:complete len:412 (-),score=91.11 TRINITY_DN4896_c0_g1_i1:352-1587(-)